MLKIQVSIKGRSPLLMNRFRTEEIDSKSKKRTGAILEKVLEDKLYLLDGKPYIPAVYFRNALIEAGKQFKITGKGKATYSKLIGSSIEIEPETIINDYKYEEFKVAAVNPMTKGRMMVSRPKFNEWAVEFNILSYDDGITEGVLKDCLEYAGSYVGIGDWRPEKKGPYGKFIVTQFKKL
jgi:hypothetical protein